VCNAIDPQKTEKVSGMKANTAARAVRITGRDRFYATLVAGLDCWAVCLAYAGL